MNLASAPLDTGCLTVALGTSDAVARLLEAKAGIVASLRVL